METAEKAFQPVFTLKARLINGQSRRWKEYSIPTVSSVGDAVQKAIQVIDTLGAPCVRVEIYADGRYIKEVPSDGIDPDNR